MCLFEWRWKTSVRKKDKRGSEPHQLSVGGVKVEDMISPYQRTHFQTAPIFTTTTHTDRKTHAFEQNTQNKYVYGDIRSVHI